MANSYTYTVYAMDATSVSECASAGFPSGHKATNTNLVIVDRKDNAIPVQTTVPTKPSYVVESMSNWPYLTHTEALQLISYEATTSGGSDGWFYNKKS
jgi:hypothetical protein|tara:strand:- start:2901 stop:3194 length:294 start_codon:yes stop_codon:yes gene_type:complete